MANLLSPLHPSRLSFFSSPVVFSSCKIPYKRDTCNCKFRAAERVGEVVRVRSQQHTTRFLLPSPSSSMKRTLLILSVLLLVFVVLLASAKSMTFADSRRGGAGDDGRFPAKLKLERALPSDADLQVLKSRDKIRHRSLFQRLRKQQVTGVVNFPVDGSSNPYTVGLYFTRIKLGNPAKEFYVQIDTGSDILWVTCLPCYGCPNGSGLNIQLNSFDPSKSSSASLIPCSDERCRSDFQPSLAGCTSFSANSLCGYSFQYGDGSGTSGYYVSDAMHLQMITSGQTTENFAANVIFGCSNLQSGGLTKPDIAVDGIFGLGPHDLSIVSQLSNIGVAPKVFSHCLRGSDNGGGILVLGEVVESDIVYTPLVRTQPHYTLNLRSIAVNGQILPIDPSVFAASGSRGTIVDSGTTLTYLVAQAYDPFVNAITTSVSPSVQSFVSKGQQCFMVSSRSNDAFPLVTLNFEGTASMILRPQDYLVQQVSIDNNVIWCLGWQKNQETDITILGDLVLKDKIFVYDLAQQRIGWANYDCSLSVNVSLSGKNEYVNNGRLSSGLSSQNALQNLIFFLVLVQVFLVHFLYC